MKVLLPVATEQSLVVRPRANTATVDLTIRDILKDITTVTSGITTTFLNGFLTIPFTHDFSEGETYEVEITNNADDSLVWRGQIFVTSQTPQNYTFYP